MLVASLIICLSFLWLLYETKYLRVHLLVGPLEVVWHKWDLLLCGDAWYNEHRNDYHDWKPTISLRVNGSTHTLTLPLGAKGIIKEIIKINTRPLKPVKQVYPVKHYALGMAGPNPCRY